MVMDDVVGQYQVPREHAEQPLLVRCKRMEEHRSPKVLAGSSRLRFGLPCELECLTCEVFDEGELRSLRRLRLSQSINDTLVERALLSKDALKGVLHCVSTAEGIDVNALTLPNPHDAVAGLAVGRRIPPL